MTEYQKRRQKALLKKRRKEKEKRKKQSRFSSVNEHAHKIYLIKNAKNYPLFECLINTDWQDKGMAHIYLSRRQPNNKLILGVYLVDIFCLGLKNTFSNASMSIEEYQKLKLSLFEETAISSYSPAKAYRIIIGAIEYAKKIGFKPQQDFDLSQYVLEGVILPRGKPRGIFSAALNQAAQALALVPCVAQYIFQSHHESFGLQLSVQNIHPPTSPLSIISSSVRETRETIPVHCCSLLS